MNITTGIILVDHGSKLAAANDMLLDVVKLFQKQSGHAIVEPAHMELAEPSIDVAFNACVARGADLVIVHPYFLAPGRHSTQDIPRMVAQAASRHPAVRFHVTEPLGLHAKIAEVMMERIAHCVNSDLQCETCAEAAG